MKANEFVKKFGWGEAKKLIENHEKCYMPDVFDMWSDEMQDFVLATKYASFKMVDLKRMVESWELVGGRTPSEIFKMKMIDLNDEGGWSWSKQKSILESLFNLDGFGLYSVRKKEFPTNSVRMVFVWDNDGYMTFDSHRHYHYEYEHEQINTSEFYRLIKAIADVESCQ